MDRSVSLKDQGKPVDTVLMSALMLHDGWIIYTVLSALTVIRISCSCHDEPRADVRFPMQPSAETDVNASLALLDDWLDAQRVLLAQTHTDIEMLRKLRADPLSTEPVHLSALALSPPPMPWNWAAFDGCDYSPFFAVHRKPPPTGPRPLSEFVHNAKTSMLVPFFEKWELDWDPAPPPPRKAKRRKFTGSGRTVISYLTPDPAGEGADVDIGDDAVPEQKITWRKRKREPSPPPQAANFIPTHATKAVPSSSKRRSETFKQAWSESEQNLLERLLEQYPEGEKNRWKKISLSMGNRRTPRQVASRVQKYFAKLKKFGLG